MIADDARRRAGKPGRAYVFHDGRLYDLQTARSSPTIFDVVSAINDRGQMLAELSNDKVGLATVP